MNRSDTDNINGSEDDSPSKPRRGILISPRAEAFKNGRRMKKKDGPEDPFDPHKYREIYSETD